jgi:glycosyltransferase involved in cell wall biosynthesis
MFFSIIIPTYNREKIIPRAIKSILNQTFTDYEIIIVDDGSVDKTDQVVRSFNDNRIKYHKTTNFGVAHARNYGIKMANGDYIGFLDSDDLMEHNHLLTAHTFIKEEKSPEVIHLNFSWGSEDKTVTHNNKLPLSLPKDIFNTCSLHVNCIFLKNEIAKVNHFNESRDLMFAEDWDFFIKLATRFKIHLLDKKTTYLIDHADRSMRDFDETKWVLKRDAITLSLKDDKLIKEKYSEKVRIVTAHMNSLIALNFAIKKMRKKSIVFWILSLKQNFMELFTRRSLAIIKHLILI